MQIGVIGINYKSADLTLRENIARVSSRRFDGQAPHFGMSYVLLSTCNRTEIYFCSTDLPCTHSYLLAVLREEIPTIEFEHRLYSYFGEDCFFHLARVTAGMDSALIGETEIQGQVKGAYVSAARLMPLDAELHFLFQKCLKIAKGVRSSFLLARGMPSLEETILRASKNVLGEFHNQSILFFGISDINQKIFSCFKSKGHRNITFCNRSFDKAIKIAEREKIQALPWHERQRWIYYDLVIFGTKAPDFVISNQGISLAFSKQYLLIDLSVPRNVDPRIGRLPGVTLINIDQINRGINRKKKIKVQALSRIEAQYIAHAVSKQMVVFHRKQQFRYFQTSA
ncbi:MAG: glutamyl-tRNA reductase [Chlamydiia bacterium]|nr:glutamyl-tRNA reductase [Chlamydiia bacterium]